MYPPVQRKTNIFLFPKKMLVKKKIWGIFFIFGEKQNYPNKKLPPKKMPSSKGVKKPNFKYILFNNISIFGPGLSSRQQCSESLPSECTDSELRYFYKCVYFSISSLHTGLFLQSKVFNTGQKYSFKI